MANRTQIQIALQKPYDRILFGKEVLSPVFGSCFSLSSSNIPAAVQPNKTEQTVVGSISIYGNINLEDGTEITCYEISLQPTVRIEQSRVAIQRYVRKLLTAGQIALVNFISPQNKSVWRLTLVAKDSEITEDGIKEKTTHAKRYTYLLGPSETCKTAAERFESLSTETRITFQTLVNAFSVEKLSDAFFDEYTLHYQKFCDYLQESNFRKSVFKISFATNATKEEKDKACKPIRDFVKKLLGRIVFLYFVQKKRWLGASDTNYRDGLTDFIKQLFKQSGGNDAFYSTWLTILFFETLNKERNNDDFKMPDGKKVKVPFLNGGLFDKEDYDEHILTFKSKLFHNPDFEDTILTEKNLDYSRGFLDFLNSFNFTVHEDSPDDHIVAVDPEMLGHIFENLLEDNKDKGAFYTPKEIVHYMCHESLTEYLTTHLSKEYTVYREIGNAQVELFGNETKQGQLKIVEQMGDRALNRDDVAYIVKYKDISKLTKAQLQRIDQLLDSVKICDPAIGSGAFPMGLLQEIFAIKEVIAFELGLQWKPAEVKENIIQNSIYGVDIEKGAVDIARLRFWLSLVVDEEKPRSLPNLDYKIVVGDSLLSKFEGEIIEIDWERKSGVGKAKEYIENIQRLLREIAEKQRKFFTPDNKNKKKQQSEIRNLKLELLVNQLSYNKEKFVSSNIEKGGFAPTANDLRYNEDLKQKRKDFDKHIAKLQKLKNNKEEPFEHFDWKLDFPEVLNPNLIMNERDRGFDIVIGNPPYVDSRTNSQESKDFWKKIYHSAKTGKTNAYEVFIEKGLSLLKPERRLCFIVPIVLLNLESCKGLRELLLRKYSIEEIAYGESAVFQNANVDTMIIFISNLQSHSDAIKINKFSNDYSSIDKTTFLKSANISQESGYKIAVKSNTITESFSFSNGTFFKISEVLDFYNGIATGPDKEKYFSFEKVNKNYKPLIMGNNIGYYQINDEGRFINYDRSKLHRPREESIFLATEKIVMQRIRNLKLERRLVCSLDTHKFYTFNSVNNLLLKSNCKLNIRYFLALLNSKLLNYILKQQSLNTNITQSDLELLPLKKLSSLNSEERQIHNVIVTIVNYILLIKSIDEGDSAAKLTSNYFVRVIDGIIYELYFPEQFSAVGIKIVTYLFDLPILTGEDDESSKRKDIKSIVNAYRRLTDPSHPVDSALLKLNNIEEVKIIEGS